jgi:malonyl-CoA O-methyltransferase
MTSTQRPPTLDPGAVARWQRIAPATPPWLHEEVAARMLDRLQWIKLQPQAWADWGAVRGGLKAHAELVRKYPKSACFVAEAQQIRVDAAIKDIAIQWWNPARWGRQPVRFEFPPPASVDMLWANMLLHEAADPQALLAEWHKALAVSGFLMFSCLGPDTAKELRDLYRQLGWPPAGHDLTDMHDWGDMLVQAGFAEPVMDMERITLTYETPARLLEELAELGRNFHPRRFAALRGRGWKARLEGLLAERLQAGPDGRLQLTFEVIYGHALKPQPKMKVSALSSVSIDDMRSMLKGASAAPRNADKAAG